MITVITMCKNEQTNKQTKQKPGGVEKWPQARDLEDDLLNLSGDLASIPRTGMVAHNHGFRESNALF